MNNPTALAVAAGDTSRDWSSNAPASHEINQAHGITAQTTIVFEPLPETLVATSGFYRWERDVRRKLESEGLPHLLDAKYLRPKKTDENGPRWKIISMDAAAWMLRHMSADIRNGLMGPGRPLVFADEVFAAITSRMTATGILADIEKWDSFRKIRLSDYPSVPAFLTAILKMKKDLLQDGLTPRPYTLVLMILSELRFESPRIMDGTYKYCKSRGDHLRSQSGFEGLAKYLINEFKKHENLKSSAEAKKAKNNTNTTARVERAVAAAPAVKLEYPHGQDNTLPADGGSQRVVKREYPESDGDLPRLSKRAKTEN